MHEIGTVRYSCAIGSHPQFPLFLHSRNLRPVLPSRHSDILLLHLFAHDSSLHFIVIYIHNYTQLGGKLAICRMLRQTELRKFNMRNS